LPGRYIYLLFRSSHCIKNFFNSKVRGWVRKFRKFEKKRNKNFNNNNKKLRLRKIKIKFLANSADNKINQNIDENIEKQVTV
jgi:hypothetical protein